MSADELAALFDMVRSHVALVNFAGSAHAPGYDLYSTRPSAVHQRAMKVLETAGLAHPEQWADVTFYRLDEAARAALEA